MRTIVMQEVNNGYLVQVHEARILWHSECHAGNPYVYRNLEDFIKDVYKLFGKTPPEPRPYCDPATVQKDVNWNDLGNTGTNRCYYCGQVDGHGGLLCPKLNVTCDASPK